MGSGASAPTKQEETLPQHRYCISEDMAEFSVLGMGDSEISHLEDYFDRFSPVHVPKLGHTVKMDHLFFTLGVPKNHLAVKIFDLNDIETNFSVTFHNFVLCMWSFLSMNKDDLNSFSFGVHNLSNSKMLASKELLRSIGYIYVGTDPTTMEARNICEQQIDPFLDLIDTMSGQVVDREAYLTHIETYPCLVQPVFELQYRLRDVVLGRNYWEKKESRAHVLRKSVEVQTMFNTEKAYMLSGVKPQDNYGAEKELANAEKQYGRSMKNMNSLSSRTITSPTSPKSGPTSPKNGQNTKSRSFFPSTENSEIEASQPRSMQLVGQWSSGSV